MVLPMNRRRGGLPSWSSLSVLAVSIAGCAQLVGLDGDYRRIEAAGGNSNGEGGQHSGGNVQTPLGGALDAGAENAGTGARSEGGAGATTSVEGGAAGDGPRSGAGEGGTQETGGTSTSAGTGAGGKSAGGTNAGGTSAGGTTSLAVAGEAGAAETGSGGTNPHPDCSNCKPGALGSFSGLLALTIKSPLLFYVDADSTSSAMVGKLMSMSTNGGTASSVTLAPAPEVTSLLADREYIYAGTSRKIQFLPINGDYAFAELTGSPDYGPKIRVNSSYVFGMWTLTGTHISRLPRAGGTGEYVISNNLNDWIGYDVDESLVFPLTKTLVSSVPVLGGSANPVAVADPGEVFSSVMVADATRLALFSNTRIALVDKVGGDLSTLVAKPAYAAVSDGQSLYYFRFASGDSCAAGSNLYAMPLDGGREQHLATETGACISNLVQDAKAVYWLPADRKTIHKANKL